MTKSVNFKRIFIRVKINLIFSFQNIMTFNKCSIKGKVYGDIADDLQKGSEEVS